MAKDKEWEKEMMKWSKQNLIDLLEKMISESKQQQTSDGGLNIPLVSNRREQLIDFSLWYCKNYPDEFLLGGAEPKHIDEFLKSINCG